MPVDGEAAGSRVPRSTGHRVGPVVSHLSDGGLAVQEKCPSCGRWRIYFAAPADACCEPTFTHAHNLSDDFPDHDAIDTINGRAHHNGPSHADEFYRPVVAHVGIDPNRTVDPRDLL